MHTKSEIALGQFPKIGLLVYRVDHIFWNGMSHFGFETINQKSSIASRGLGENHQEQNCQNQDHVHSTTQVQVQVPWGSGDSENSIGTRVPTSSKGDGHNTKNRNKSENRNRKKDKSKIENKDSKKNNESSQSRENNNNKNNKKSNIHSTSVQKSKPMPEQNQVLMCPVCGQKLTKRNLPDAEGIFTDGICYYETDKIISSQLFIEHEFSHFYNEEKDCIMENPHTLKTLIAAEFDNEGECTVFHVVKVWSVQRYDDTMSELL